MADSTASSVTNDDGSAQSEERTSSETPKIWRSAESLEIPTGPAADILTYTFANLGQYDQTKPIFVDALNPANTFSARDIRTLVRKLIAGLKKHGLQQGDCVCLHAFNSIWYPLIWLAVVGAGGVIFGSNPRSPSAELLHHLQTTCTKFLITETTSLKVAGQVASACQISNDKIFVLPRCDQPVPAGRRAFIGLLNHGESDWFTANSQGDGNSSRIAAYCTTSGTTGLPKAAQIPHSYVVAQAQMVESRLRSRPYEPSQLMCLPVFHTFAAPIGLVQPLRLGVTTYFLPRFDLEKFADAVNSFDITDTAIVPPILAKLAQFDLDDNRLKSLRYVLCAGAPISAELQNELYPFIHPEATIAQVWGATELGWVSMFGPDEKDKSGSIGTLLPGIELKIVDPVKGSVCTDLVHGEALVRSPAAFSGYLENVEATTAAFDGEGFYRTGDRLYVNNDKFHIDGRIKDIMKVNGWQVSPSEIEKVLIQHPEVSDVAVVGVTFTNEQGLEITRPRAFVVKKRESYSGNAPPSKKEIEDFVASRLVSYKRITGGVFFVDAIPRNPTGKILRRLLLAAQSKETPI